MACQSERKQVGIHIVVTLDNKDLVSQNEAGGVSERTGLVTEKEISVGETSGEEQVVWVAVDRRECVCIVAMIVEIVMFKKK